MCVEYRRKFGGDHGMGFFSALFGGDVGRLGVHVFFLLFPRISSHSALHLRSHIPGFTSNTHSPLVAFLIVCAYSL